MRSIIVPLDGSELSEQVIPLAHALTVAIHGELTLAQVVLEPWLASTPKDVPALPALMEQAAKYHLDNLALPLGAGVVETLVLRGDPVDQLLALALERQPALFVMSTHGHGGLGRLLMGSVADKVMRGSPVPVLLVRGTARLPVTLERLLVALDGSTVAERALPLVVELAQATGASVRLVRVVMPFVNSLAALAPETIFLRQAQFDEIDEQALAEARDYLERIAAPLREQGIRVECHVRYGTTRDELLLAAEQAEYAADLIVATTHGWGGLRRWAIGSVVTELVQRAPCPVLVVPSAGLAAETADLDARAAGEDVPTSWL